MNAPEGHSPATVQTGLPLQPPYDSLLATDRVLAWVQVDLTLRGRFGEEVLALLDGCLVRLSRDATGGAVEVGRWPLTPSHPPELVERKGYLVLAQPGSGEELARCTTARMTALAEFAGRVKSSLESGASPPSPSVSSDLCPSCGGPRTGTRCPRCHTWLRTLSRLLGEVAPHWRQALGIGILLLLGTLVSLAPPYLVKTLVDRVLKPGATLSSLAGVIGLMALVMASDHLISLARQVLRSRLKGELGHKLRVRAFDALTRFSQAEVSRATPAGLAQTVLGDVGKIVELVMSHGLAGLFHGLMVAGTVGMLLWMSPLLAVVVLAPAPLLRALTRRLARRGQTLVTRVWTESALVSSRVWNFLQGFRVVKVFAGEGVVSREFARQSEALRLWEYRTEINYSIVSPALSVVTGVGGLLVWGYGGYLVLQSHIGVGSLVAYVSYLGMFYGHVQALVGLLASAPRSWAACEHYLEILDTVPAVRQAARPVRPERWAGAIRLDRVSFSYVPGREVLHDVDLSIEPGELIGLVGRSGSGKTTLVNLITRLYDPTRGRIALDGVPLADIDLDLLRSRIAVVLQTPFLFEGSVIENLRLGRPDASFREVCEAADRALAHDFIMKLPDGYDTLLTDQVRLSTGEQQRLTIARALLRDPRILILDEATASVDTHTERLIQNALAELVAGRTTIAIAHRLSTLARADRIVVIDDGRVVECAPHAVLQARPGVYRDLVTAQAEMMGVRLDAGGTRVRTEGWRGLDWLDPARARVAADPGGLSLTVDSVVTPGLVPVQALPWSDPAGHVCLADRRGATVGILERPQGLDAASRQALDEALDRHVFAPEILEVDAFDFQDGTYLWKVQTTAGPRSFTTHMSWGEQPVVRTALGELLVRADDGIRYRIRSPDRLSERARRLLFPVL